MNVKNYIPFYYKPKEKELSTVVYDRITTIKGANSLILKPIKRALLWVKFAGGELPKHLGNALRAVKYSSKGISCLDLPTKIGTAALAVYAIGKSIIVGDFLLVTEKATEFIEDGSSAGSLVADVAIIAYKEGVYTLTERTLQILDGLKFLGLSVLFCSSVYAVIQEGKNLLEAERFSAEFIYSLARLIAKITLVVACLFGMGAQIVGSAIVSEWIALSVGTIMLLSSIFSYIYGEMRGVRAE